MCNVSFIIYMNGVFCIMENVSQRLWNNSKVEVSMFLQSAIQAVCILLSPVDDFMHVYDWTCREMVRVVVVVNSLGIVYHVL